MANRDLTLRVILSGVTTDLDIDSNIPLRIDISSLENDKIGRVFGVGSQTFDLPGTRKNNKFFKNANDPGGIDTPGFYDFIEAYVLLDGDIIVQGQLYLQEVICSDDGWITYKVQIVDQTIDFKTKLEGKFIAQADWSNLLHTMSGDTILNSWDNNLLDGQVFYPLCDFGTDNNIEFPALPRIQVNGSSEQLGNIDCSGSTMGLQQFQPAIKATTVFDVMFDQAGYNYTSSLITGSIGGPFSNLYTMVKSNDELGPVLSGSIDNTILVAYTASEAFAGIPSSTYVLYTASFYNELSDPGNNYSSSGAGAPRYTAPVDGQYTIDMSLELTDCSPNNPSSTKSVVVTSELQVYNLSDSLINIVTMGSRAFTVAFPAGNATVRGTRQIQLSEGDYFIPVVDFFNNDSSTTGKSFSIISGSDTYLNMTVAPFNYSGTTIDIASQWDADTKTSDVLKGFIEQFNLVVTPEYGTERTIRIETFDTWMLEGREVDWTQKYDTSKRVSIKHPISEQNKTLQIGNAEDNDRFSKIAQENEPNLQYGTKQIVSTSEVPLGTRSITTYFAPVIVGSLIQSGSVTAEGKPTFNLSGNQMFVPHLYKLGNASQETFTFKPRLGYKIDDILASAAFNSNIYFGDQGGTAYTASFYSTLANISTLNTATPVIYNLHFDSQYPDYTAIGGAYQTAELLSSANYDLYWNNYIQGLYWDEARKVTLDLEFTPEEYKDIRLNDIIIIKNQKYRINKIKGFNVMYPDVVTVELLKEYPVYNNITDIQPTPASPFYYQIQNCDGGAIENTTVLTQSFSPTLGINLRVSGSDGNVYKVSNYVTTSGSLITSITDTGLIGCPAGPGPVDCQFVTISVNRSGDSVSISGSCCDGDLLLEIIEDYGSITVCVQEDSWEVFLYGASAGYTVGGSCTTLDPCVD